MENFTLREATLADATGIAFVNYQSWRETYRGLIDHAYLNSLTINHYNQKWVRILKSQTAPSFSCVIETAEGKIAGYSCCGKTFKPYYHFNGEIQALYLLKEYQGLGLGKKLFLRCIQAMKEAGFTGFHLFVLKNNPAEKFYRSFKPDFEEDTKVTIDNREYDDVGFGWNNYNNFE